MGDDHVGGEGQGVRGRRGGGLQVTSVLGWFSMCF